MSQKVQIIHDTYAKTPIAIRAYIHCSKCLEEMPDNITPKDWARTQAGYTKDGIQVVCTRHNCNIDSMKIQVAPRKGNP